jgi:hypothetical protein
MGIATKRKVTLRGTRGASKSVVIPANIKTGQVATIAANRLVLLDPRGEIPEDDLLQFLENFVEPQFWTWLTLKKKGDETK